MSAGVLQEQKNQALIAIRQALQNVDRVEKMLLSKQGSSSRAKIVAHVAATAGVMLGAIVMLGTLAGEQFGSLGEFSLPVLLIATLSTVVFSISQTQEIMVNKDYYTKVFEGLERVAKVRQYLQNYQAGLEQKHSTWEKTDGWNTKLKKGWNFQKELENAEKEILGTETKQVKHIGTLSIVSYAISAVSVAMLEVFLLQEPICSMLYESFGYVEWVSFVYKICAAAAALGGPGFLYHYLVNCKGKEISMISLLWILAGGFVGIVGVTIIAFVIGATLTLVFTILRIVWEIVKVMLIIAGAILFIFALAGAFSRR